jgi:hypothetical protein
MKNMENKQTAVEWLENEIRKEIGTLTKGFMFSLIEQAKEMEKSQISKSYEKGWVNGDLKKAPRFGAEYYDNEYKNNE